MPTITEITGNETPNKGNMIENTNFDRKIQNESSKLWNRKIKTGIYSITYHTILLKTLYKEINDKTLLLSTPQTFQS